MMSKEYGREVLAAIRDGDPITSSDPRGVWSVADMLAVAGACLFGAWSHDPAFPQPDLNEEQRASRDEGHIASVVGAAEFLSHVFSHLADGEWEFPDVLQAVVQGDQARVIG